MLKADWVSLFSRSFLVALHEAATLRELVSRLEDLPLEAWS